MSYHILHQFDEQWLADLKQDDEGNGGRSLLNSSGEERQDRRRAKIVARESHRWAVVAASILMATFALLFALDANHRAETLQQRLDAVEASIKK
jgi:ubiquitin C-terminal hydrolase